MVDGVVGPITWSHLNPYREASPAAQGWVAFGPEVAMLQRVLKIELRLHRAIDGVSRPATEAVALQYQATLLPVTGMMDEQMWMAPAGAAGCRLESLAIFV